MGSERAINSLLNSVPAYRTRDYLPLASPSWKITRAPKTISKQSKLIRADARDDRVFCSRINREMGREGAGKGGGRGARSTDL